MSYFQRRFLIVLCRIAPIGMIQLDTTPTGRILHSLCRAESGVRSCTEIGANGQPDKALLIVLCRIAQIGVIQLDTTPTERILYSLCRAESGVRPCTEIGANGQPDKALLTAADICSSGVMFARGPCLKG